MPVVKTPGPKGAKVDPTRQSISRGKQDGRYHTVTKNLDLTMRLLVMRDGRPPHDQVRTLVDESLSKVQGYLTDDLNRAVHVWSGKVIAMYKYLTLKEMKVFIKAANKSDLFANLKPGLDEKQAIFTAFWDNYHPKNAEKVFLWLARFIQFDEPLSSDGIMPPGSFWVKTVFVNLAVKTKLHLDAPNGPDSTWPELQAFFDTFPQRHPVHHRVHINHFKIRADPKTIRHSGYIFAPPVVIPLSSAAKMAAAVDSVKAIAATATATATASSAAVQRIIRKPRITRREMLLSRRKIVREMSMVSEGEVCVSSSSRKVPIKQASSHERGRINKIEKGSVFDKMSITDYVLQSDTVQAMLLHGNS